MNKHIETRIMNLRDNLEAGCQSVADQARTAVASSARMVRRDPHLAVGLAALAGAVLGILMSRSR